MESSKFWQQWLEKYKDLNCLWDSTNQATANDRLLAWDELVEMAKLADYPLDTPLLVGYLRKFVTNYRLQASKVKAAEANGIWYEPKDIYYKIFKSMEETTKPANSQKRVKEIKKYSLKGETSSPLLNIADRKTWRKFLKRYVLSKCLWDNNGETRYTSIEREEAYGNLLKVLQKFNANADLTVLKRRINNFRCAFLREYKRVQQEKMHGRVHVSSLFYYDILKPIYEKGQKKIEFSSDEESPDEESEENNIEQPSPDTTETQKNKAGAIQRKYEFVTSRNTDDKKIWRKLLKRYVSYKCLWDYNNQTLYNHEQRADAWSKLLRIFKKIAPHGDLRLLKARINNSRCVFRREFKRVIQEKKRGREHVSSLFYFDIMKAIYQKGKKNVEFSSDEKTSDDENAQSTPSLQTGENAQDTSPLEAELKKNNLIYAPLKIDPKYVDQKVWLEVIKKFVCCECLWNTENRDYYNTDTRDRAWLKLTEIVQKVYKNANVDYVKKRIQRSRTVYKRQLKIAQEAIRKGRNYEIKLFYFNAMSPLYQKGFPILDYDENDVLIIDDNPLDFKTTLNPISNTYFPDDDVGDDDVELDNDKTGETENDFETSGDTLMFKADKEEEDILNFDADTINYSEEDIFEEKPELQTFETTNFETVECNEITQNTSNSETTNFKDVEYDEPIEVEKTDKSQNQLKKLKSKVIQSSTTRVAKNKFDTFEAIIAQHLESMDEDQFLWSEKFIIDICISGRHKELTKRSCLVLGNVTSKNTPKRSRK